MKGKAVGCARDRPSLGHRHPADAGDARRDRGRRRRRRAEAGGPDRQRARGARRAPARAGRGDLPADRHDGEPDRDPPPHRARRRADRRGELPRLHLRARRPGRPLRRRHARASGRGRAVQRRAGTLRLPRPRDPLAADTPALDREHPQRERRADLAARRDRRAARTGARARPRLPPRRRAAPQRSRRPRHRRGRDRLALRHRHALPLEGTRLPARRDPRRATPR